MLADFFARAATVEAATARPAVTGRITRLRGELIEARGLQAGLGDLCLLDDGAGGGSEAEVIGFNDDTLSLMPLYPVATLQPGSAVHNAVHRRLPTGSALFGRVVDGLGKPIDKLGPIQTSEFIPEDEQATNPLDRRTVDEPLDVGIRAINAVNSVGCGQRIGLFAGSGVGKSVLLGMMTQFTSADVVVVALVGERGREVTEFVEHTLAKAAHKNYIVVAATADSSPLMRLKAGQYASQIAEHFRDRGQRVLLLFDSLTRYAQAQREIALALGEPPATRGYPASVFAKVPQLVERAGNGEAGGSVTGIYTVLTESDDLQDPVAESARAILDGHLVLARELAEEGIYPALDLVQSVSRVMNRIASPEHREAAARIKAWLSRYQSIKELIRIGAYQAGEDPETDIAVSKYPQICDFVSQRADSAASFEQSLNHLLSLATRPQPQDPQQFAHQQQGLQRPQQGQQLTQQGQQLAGASSSTLAPNPQAGL